MEPAMRTTGLRFGLSALICTLAAAAAYGDETAIAEPRTCMPRDGAEDKLHAEYGEKIVGHGLSRDGTLLEIYLAPSGSFTVIKTTPAGLSCVVDFGEGWQTLNQLEQVGFTPETLKSVPDSSSY
jgi:hypothetical protein